MVNFFRFLLTAEKMSFAGGFASQAGSGGYPPAGLTPSSSSTPSTQVELAVKCTGNITLLHLNPFLLLYINSVVVRNIFYADIQNRHLVLRFCILLLKFWSLV